MQFWDECGLIPTGTPTEQADQRGEVKKKCEVEKNRPVGQCQKSLGHGLVVAASAVEG